MNLLYLFNRQKNALIEDKNNHDTLRVNTRVNTNTFVCTSCTIGKNCIIVLLYIPYVYIVSSFCKKILAALCFVRSQFNSLYFLKSVFNIFVIRPTITSTLSKADQISNKRFRLLKPTCSFLHTQASRNSYTWLSGLSKTGVSNLTIFLVNLLSSFIV